MNAVLPSFLRCFSAATLTFALVAGAFATAPPAAPTILSLRTNRTSLLVKVQAPKGWQAIVLESRERPDTGAWVPRAVTRSKSGKIVFKLPASLQGQALQVRGRLQEPLPKKFYKGTHTFAKRRSSFWRPDQGRGEVFSVAANGSLPGSASAPSTATTTRTVVESDIWKISGNTLYFFNQLRGLQVIDISNPDAPVVHGMLDMPAVGEEMFLLDAQHVVLLARDSCDRDWQSELVVVDVSGSAPRTVATLPVPGWVGESRLAGSALYVTSEGCQPGTATEPDGWQWGTLVSSFDLANPAAPVARSSLWFAGAGNAVLATDRFLFVALADYSGDTQPVPEVRVLDISAPNGTVRNLAGIPTAGIVNSKFNMNLAGDVFTAISSDGPVSTLETFSLANPASPAPLGSLVLSETEGLFATRFDGDRAYAVTYQFIDPLWVIDLSNPARPAIAGSVDVPGWSTYIQPLGGRLLTLGVETNRVAVSLFDVHDPAQPMLLSRVSLGENYSWSEANYDEKALTVLTNLGLLLVPYEGDTVDGWATRVQLIDLGANSLTARGVIAHRFAPRRAAALNGRLISFSNNELLSVDATDRDHPVVKAEAELAWPVNQVFALGNYLLELSTGGGWWAATTPVVRVTAAAQPNVVLNRLELAAQPVAGTTLRSNCLFLLQSPAAYFGGPLPMDPGGATITPGGALVAEAPVEVPSSTNLLLTVLDLSALPAIQVLSQTTLPTKDTFGGNFEALWPSPDLLVWFSSGFGFWINPLVDAWSAGVLPPTGVSISLPVAVLGRATPILASSQPVSLVPVKRATAQPAILYPPASTGLAPRPAVTGSQPFLPSSQPFLCLPYWRPWWNNGGVRLIALNVMDPASPQLISDLNFSPTNGWGFSKPFASPGFVYFTHEQPTNAAPSQPISSSLDWRVSDFLDVIDYSDPSTPTVRPPVNVPGQLAGLSANGAMLYLLGNSGSRASVETREALNACAYDGVTAYVVASLPLPPAWPRPVLVNNDTVYLGRAASGSQESNTLEAWSLSAAGRFARQASVSLAQPASALAIFGDLLAAQDMNNSVTLLDAGTPSALTIRGRGGPSGCLWFDLNHADGALDSGLWIPLDEYGVSFVPVN